MTGLEKFENSESWRTRLKKFLLIERKPTAKKTLNEGEMQRHCLDIGKDLQDLLRERKKQIEIEKLESNLKERKISIEETNMSTSKSNTNGVFCKRIKKNVDVLEKTSDESFEVLERMCEKTASDPNSTLFRYLHGDEGGAQACGESEWQKACDESFEALERMCNKTASDPNSTLFQYLHSDHKEEVLADAKKRSTDGNVVNFSDLDAGNKDILLDKFSDFTLLDDIEAPSRIWENTITVDAGFRTSPVKMVGLMRPSTIIEEAADESANSEMSSHASFQTATTKGELLSDVSSAYDTAHDSTVTSARNNELKKQCGEREIDVDELLTLALDKKSKHNEETEIDVDELLMLALEKKNNDFLSSKKSYTPPTSEIDTATESHNGLSANTSDLIDLEKTFSPNNNSHHQLEKDTEVDVVIIDDDDQVEVNGTEYNDEDEEDLSIIDILSDEEDRLEEHDIKLEVESQDKSFEDNKENIADVHLEESRENELSTRSIEFNDTIEEVEYLLKMGMEYRAAKENAERPLKDKDENESTTLQISSLESKKKDTVRSDPASKVTLQSSSTFIKTPNKNIEPSTNRYGIDMRPFPKLDIFGKSPQASIGHPRRKELSNKQFAHVISPIGTYMKKTASTPLMSTCKMKNKNSNVLNSLASRELEYESSLCQPRFGTHSSKLRTEPCTELAPIPGISGVQKTLPKKAYISSEFKHIIDERTPVTIPGGKKIQKYLENAMMPAVLRHDGKMKIAGGINASPSTKTALSFKVPQQINGSKTSSTTSTSHRNNASLADLSVMSGDVSMYTIMDAQKF